MRAYLILSLKWAITLLLSYCIYTTTHNTYLSLALLWVMAWQQMNGLVIGNMLIEQEEHDKQIRGLVVVAEGHWAITEGMISVIDKHTVDVPRGTQEGGRVDS